MRAVLLVALLLRHSLAAPTLEDNKLPSDREMLGGGQPEEVASLGLPSDEDSFNHLSVFFNPSISSSPVASGTYHFVSSTFPEIDARGFHESVFDGIGDYFPSWPSPYKRQGIYPLPPSFAQRLGLQPHKFRKRSEPWTVHSTVRKKRVVQSDNSSQALNIETFQPQNPTEKRRTHLEQVLFENKGQNTKVDLNNKAFSNDALYKNYHVVSKRSLNRNGRGMEMGSLGFHGDIFNGDFGDFTTMRKRARGALGFHGDTFSDGFGDFTTMKRSSNENELRFKLKNYVGKLAKNTEEGLNDLDDVVDLKNKELYIYKDNFNNGLGHDFKVNKRRPEMDAMGFHGDTFSRGFGEFEPFKKRKPAAGSMGFHGDTFSQGFGDFDTYKKRRPEMDSSGFHGDTFSRGFGEFEPFKRKVAGSMGFHGDTFSQGFGDFDTYKKRRPEMDSMGFHGDMFSRGFGDFEPLKKRKPLIDSMGFHGDTFSQGFGDFATFKKRRPAAGSMGFHGDTFSQGFGDFDTYKKRRPEMDSSGFHGDTFSRGFGDFEALKKRRPSAGSMGFHGDTFSQGFGDFDTYKKKRSEKNYIQFGGDKFGEGFGEVVASASSSSQEARNLVAGDDRTEDKSCCSDSSIQRHQDTH